MHRTAATTPDRPAGLLELLDQELLAVEAVLAALDAEGRALEHRDAGALAAAVERKTIAVAEAARLEQARRAENADPGSDPEAAAGRLLALKSLARRCRDLNDRNGALIRAQRQRVEGALQFLQGGPGAGHRHGDTYGPDGTALRAGGRRGGALARW